MAVRRGINWMNVPYEGLLISRGIRHRTPPAHGKLFPDRHGVRDVGHSVAQFLLPNANAAWVLQTAYAHAAQHQMRVATSTPNQAVFTKGSIWWTSERWLSVAAWDAPGGANVLVEAWIQGIIEENADPGPFVGMIPRRDAWAIAAGLVAHLGVNPLAVFRHL